MLTKRNPNHTKAITFSIELFNKLRGAEARLWFKAFKVLIGMIKYCTTMSEGRIRFDDSRHKQIVIQRLGMGESNFNNGLQFLVSKRILKELDRYRYVTNPDLIGLLICWPPEAEREREGGDIESALLEAEKENESIEYVRYLLNEEMAEGMKTLNKKHRSQQTI